MWILDFNKLSKHVCLNPQKVEIFKVKQPIGKLNTYFSLASLTLDTCSNMKSIEIHLPVENTYYM